MASDVWTIGAAAAAGLLAGLLLGWLVRLARGPGPVPAGRAPPPDRGVESEALRALRAEKSGLEHALADTRAALADSETRLVRLSDTVPAAAGGRRRPMGLSAPRGTPDDLARLPGVGPGTAAALNALGIFHFGQIASWTAEEVAFVDLHLAATGGRISGDRWQEEARRLAAPVLPEISNLLDDPEAG